MEAQVLDELVRTWPVNAVVLISVIWIIRLEAKVMYLKRDHEIKARQDEKKEESVWQKLDSVQQQMALLLQSLSRIEGRLEERR